MTTYVIIIVQKDKVMCVGTSGGKVIKNLKAAQKIKGKALAKLKADFEKNFGKPYSEIEKSVSAFIAPVLAIDFNRFGAKKELPKLSATIEEIIDAASPSAVEIAEGVAKTDPVLNSALSEVLQDG